MGWKAGLVGLVVLAAGSTARADHDSDLREAAELGNRVFFSAGGGLGTASSGLGARVAVHRGNMELFGALGHGWLIGEENFAVGFRGYAGEPRNLFLSMHVQASDRTTFLNEEGLIEVTRVAVLVGVDVGWRFQSVNRGWFFDAAVGYAAHRWVSAEEDGGPLKAWRPGLGPGISPLMPDLNLAVGFEWP